jgi:hypothetical protein
MKTQTKNNIMNNIIIAPKGTKLNQAHFLYGLNVKVRNNFTNYSKDKKFEVLNLLVINDNITMQDLIYILQQH